MLPKFMHRIVSHLQLFSHDIAGKWRHGDARIEDGNPRLNLFPDSRLAFEDFTGIKLLVMRDEPIVNLMRETAKDEHKILNTVIDAINKDARDVIHIDVGTNYGFDLCYTAKRILAKHPNAHIAGFDPGVVRDLVMHNLAANDLADKVSFFPLACADRCGFLPVYTEADHSENNRIVNPMKLHTKHSLAPCTTLDAYIKSVQRPSAMVFVKIDTQGAEPEVLSGARNLLRHYHTVAIAEFSPASIATRHDVIAFLTKLMETHFLYDLGATRDRCVRVGDDLQSFIDAVAARSETWTDLLLLPKSAPAFSEKLSQTLTGASH